MGVYIWNKLPSEYQEVEYIESSGTQYIDTGIKASNTISTELVMRPNMSYTSEYAIFGDAWNASALFLMEYQGKYRLHNGGNYGDFANVTDEKTTIKTTPTGITINGTSYSLTAGSSYYHYNIRLFATGDGSNTNKRGRFKLYSFKIENSGTPVRDFVPCYRKSDGEIGLYDMVNNQFYTNAGTGTFTKGPDFVVHELKNAYIGEYNNKYVYDFTTKTIADLTADGWTNIDSSMAIDSNGIYNTGSGQKGPNYILSASPSKLFTFKCYFRSTTIGSRTGTFTQNEGGASGSGGIYYGLMTNSNYKLRWSGQYGNASASNSITWSANTWYIGTHTVDLVNKTLTVTVATENSPNTALVTLNKDISSIIGNITPMDRISIRLEKNYVRCKKVEVTRN